LCDHVFVGLGSWLSDTAKLEKRGDPCLKTHSWSDDLAASRALARTELQRWHPFRRVIWSIPAEHQAPLVSLTCQFLCFNHQPYTSLCFSSKK